MMEGQEEKKFRSRFFEIAISLALVVFVCSFSYKLVITPFNFQFDFSNLLSLILALFSIALSALFYFKATETSNIFYDNTYKFTREIADLLVRIESGFGERLRHLDEGYSSMCSTMRGNPHAAMVQNAQEEIKEGEEELKKKLEERARIIDDLAGKAKLQEEEKAQFVQQIELKEKELDDQREELARLNRKLNKMTSRQYVVSDGIRFSVGGVDGSINQMCLPSFSFSTIIAPLLEKLYGREALKCMTVKEIASGINKMLRKGLISSEDILQLERDNVVDQSGIVTVHGRGIVRDYVGRLENSDGKSYSRP